MPSLNLSEHQIQSASGVYAIRHLPSGKVYVGSAKGRSREGCNMSMEHGIQKAFFDWARLHPEARHAYAVPNGGHRSKATAGRLKAEGVRAGVLDVCLPKMRGGCGALYIEFKAGRNTMSKEQAEEAARLVDDGYAVACCWDALQAIEFTQAYLRGEIGPALIVLKRASPRGD